MEKKGFKLYGSKVYGVEVSDCGLKHGSLDYQALSQIVGDCILNNIIRSGLLLISEQVGIMC